MGIKNCSNLGEYQTTQGREFRKVRKVYLAMVHMKVDIMVLILTCMIMSSVITAVFCVCFPCFHDVQSITEVTGNWSVTGAEIMWS